MKYMNINFQEGKTASRRDDLESLMYACINLLRMLIWKNRESESMILHKGKNFYTQQIPLWVSQNLAMVQALKFNEEPDYEAFRANFSSLATEE